MVWWVRKKGAAGSGDPVADSGVPTGVVLELMRDLEGALFERGVELGRRDAVSAAARRVLDLAKDLDGVGVINDHVRGATQMLTVVANELRIIYEQSGGSTEDEPERFPNRSPLHALLGREEFHPLLARVMAAAAGGPVPGEVLEGFWDAVRVDGTPLLEHAIDGSKVRATFLYRDFRNEDGESASTQVFVTFAGYRDSLEMDLLAGTDVWYLVVDLPPDMVGVYSFIRADEDGLVQVKWWLTKEYGDDYCHFPTRGVDECEGSVGVVYARPQRVCHLPVLYQDHRGLGWGEWGVVRVFDVEALSLLPPNVENALKRPHPELESVDLRQRADLVDQLVREIVPEATLHPVWCYLPPTPEGFDEELPVVVLVDGQWHESVDLAMHLNHAIAVGRIPPVVVVSSGKQRQGSPGYKAWGWRNLGGPPSLGVFLTEVLWPRLQQEAPIRTGCNVVAFGSTAGSAVATAADCPDLVSCVTLLDPHDTFPTETLIPPLGDGLRRLGEVPVIVGSPTERTAFAWQLDTAATVALKAHRVVVHTVPLTDPNFHAGVDALIDAIALWTTKE